MKILLVRPKPKNETIGLQHVMIVEPLELEVLATLCRKTDQPLIIDLIIEKNDISFFIQNENPDVLCITGYITNVPTILEYCKIAKTINTKIKTVVGGVHCEVCPEHFKNEFIDFRVVRNATTVFPELLNHIENNSVLPLGILKQGEPFHEFTLPQFNFYYPIPDRHFTEKYRNKYFYIFHDKVALIKTAFGCPFKCNFCFCKEITREKYYERPLTDIITELSGIKEKEIYIVDDDFLTTKTKVLNFIEAVKKTKIDKHYLLYGRADFIAANEEVMIKFKAIGLKTVIVGFESFYDDDLEKYNKKTSSSENEKAMKILKNLDIDCFATIIIAPSWDINDFMFCRKKIKELGIHYINLQPLTPLPGTGCTVDDKNLMIPYNDFEKWDLAHVTIRPEKMSVADFYNEILITYRSILFQKGYLWSYIKKYPVQMLWKMFTGSWNVYRQYKEKIREAEEGL